MRFFEAPFSWQTVKPQKVAQPDKIARRPRVKNSYYLSPKQKKALKKREEE